VTFKSLFFKAIVLSAIIGAGGVLFNVYLNEYGLFGDVSGKSIKIWHNERTSKYLLSFNYIPANFDGILMGPSVSTTIDVKRLSGYSFYNISLGGGNVTELKLIAENVINRGRIKAMVICLYPYMTKDNGRKTTYIDPHEFWEALGSTKLLNLYINKMLAKCGKQFDLPDDRGSLKAKGHEVTAEHFKDRRKIPEDMLRIDETAYRELSALVNAARGKGVKIYGYFFPVPTGRFEEERSRAYRKKIKDIFSEEDVIWDMNATRYDFFRSDKTNYNNTGHLSAKGSEFILRDIQAEIDKCLHLSRNGHG
jgi:hypothetical protein